MYIAIYTFFCVECREIHAVSNDSNLLPAGNIMYSSSLPLDPSMDILQRWCANEIDRSPYVIMDFTQSLYLLYATVTNRRVEPGASNFSIMYSNLSNYRVNMTYMNVDGVSVRCIYSYI